MSKQLPANNIGQQLFFRDLPECTNHFQVKDFKPAQCCNRDLTLQQWYRETPRNLWNTASNYEGNPPFNACTEQAYARKCFLSQYYNYLSKNNELSPENQ